jgi:hypothetical protein
MTCQRDLKRRVRLRQAETGESYVTALRHVRAAVAEPPPSPEPAAMPPIDYLELIDITEIGAALGMRCAITLHPNLLGEIEVASMLGQLRAALAHPSLAVMREAIIDDVAPERSFDMVEIRDFRDRIARGRAGTSAQGRMAALRIDGTRGPVLVTFSVMAPPLITRQTLRIRLMIAGVANWRHPWAP